MTHFRVQVEEFEASQGRKVRDAAHLKFCWSRLTENLHPNRTVPGTAVLSLAFRMASPTSHPSSPYPQCSSPGDVLVH